MIGDYLDMISTSNTTVYNHCIRSLAFSFILIFSWRVTQSSKKHLLSVRYVLSTLTVLDGSPKYHGLRSNHLSISLSLSDTNNVNDLSLSLSRFLFLPYINNVKQYSITYILVRKHLLVDTCEQNSYLQNN